MDIRVDTGRVTTSGATTPSADEPFDEAAFEAALVEWIHGQGIEGYRRLARLDDHEALVSKFEPGFAARLHDLLALLPELFERDRVIEQTAHMAERMPGRPRVDAWLAAMHEALAAGGARLAVPDLRLAEVRTGVDSVAAIMRVVLWSDPLCGEPYTPRGGEVEAYHDAFASLADGRDIFTRYYGQFEDRAVRNHCPGAAFARVLLAHAWSACTGTEPPTS